MRAETRTLLPLDVWAAIVGANPLHASQITTAAMPNSVCSSIWKQFPWQENQMVGREDIAQAIAEAEATISEYLGYYLLPTWTADERQPTTRPAIRDLLNIRGRDLAGFASQVQLSQAHYISGGIEAKTLIEAGAAVVYTDSDGDGYPETATVTVNTTVTDAAELAVYYPAEAGDDAWEIRPFRSAAIAGGVATLVFWRHQMPLPELMDALVPTDIDGDDNANFLTTVDVYRHWNDPQQQVQFLWSPLPGWGDGALCNCGGDTCVACTAATQWGCLLGADFRQGTVHYSPATWDADTSAFDSAAWAEYRAPDRLRLWYYSGHQHQKARYPALQMDGTLARAVTYLSLSLLDREICGCENVKALVRHWREDLALNDTGQTGSTSFQVGQRVLNNPFGTTRGALFAWDAVNREGRTMGRAVRM